MGYPYGKTYLERIQANPRQMDDIRVAYATIRAVQMQQTNRTLEELTIPEQFAMLGMAFELISDDLQGIADPWHFIQDVIEALLPEKDEDQHEDQH